MRLLLEFDPRDAGASPVLFESAGNLSWILQKCLGITPSDSDIGYLGWGDYSRQDVDGTVVPCAAGGSLMLTPEISLAALRTMQERFGSHIFGRYGFSDAFHPLTGWVDPDVVGIDLGLTLLSAENWRSRAVWNWFGRQPDIRLAMSRIFEPVGVWISSRQ